MAHYRADGTWQAERPTTSNEDFDIELELDRDYEGFRGTYSRRVPGELDEPKPRLSASVRIPASDRRFVSVYEPSREKTRQILALHDATIKALEAA